MFLSGQVFTLVDASVSPAFFALAVLQVVHPVSFIAGAVHVRVHTVTIGLVVDPVALVDITIDVSELAEAVSPVVLPIALVAGTILPDLLPVAITEPANPLSGILRSS